MDKKRNHFSAFTLTEMLIVMAIFTVLSGIGISAFSGLRETVMMNESAQTLQQDIRWAQRAAILLKREPNEKWIYGIGIDFSDYTADRDNDGNNDGNYTIFKWCSNRNEYGDTLTSSEFPNYDPSVGNGRLSTSNGNINISQKYSRTTCPQTPQDGVSSGGLIAVDKRSSGNVYNTDPTKIVVPPLDTAFRFSTSRSSSNIEPVYVLFESVSGKAFFYGRDGTLINYTSTTNPTPVGSPNDFEIAVSNSEHDRATVITIHNGSGKTTSESIDKTEIARQLTF